MTWNTLEWPGIGDDPDLATSLYMISTIVIFMKVKLKIWQKKITNDVHYTNHFAIEDYDVLIGFLKNL